MSLIAFELAAAPAPRQPAENFDAPPPVTARAWIITEGKTGKVLWGFNENLPSKTASTTKMMCAYVVLGLVEKNPEVFKERVTFSKLADNTPGSTADIKAGESVTVEECLYGLLLPSGNDAGNALAEHFNARLAPPEPGHPRDLFTTNYATRANFIAEMNRTARQMGLTNTIYRSSFGDGGTDDERTSTASDLARLAWTAMQNPVFRKYVGTRRFECAVRMPNGKTRPGIWENSNKLLDIEGYDGVKTGTTTLAGNCLVSSGHRGDDHLFVVVLGATSDVGRFVDSRNLYRWAWQQRGFKK